MGRATMPMELGQGTGLGGISAGVLDVYEAERLVEALAPNDPKTIGTMPWIEQHCNLDRLNVQAHYCVANQTDEFVVEALMSFDKLPLLVHELILIETWKWKAFPELTGDLEDLRSGFKPYLLCYHEALLANLIECCLFSEAATQAVGETGLVELVDWCTRKLTYLNSMPKGEVDRPHIKKTAKEYAEEMGPNIENQRQELEFQCCMTALAILRFLTEHMTKLDLGVMSRIITPNDVPMQLVPILDRAPWTYRNEDGSFKSFVEGKWVDMAADDYLRLNKYQAQVWLGLYNMIMEPTLRKKYDINSHRKNVLVDMRKYFNVALIDQLPCLSDLQRTIEEMNMAAAAEASHQTFFVLEQVATMREDLVKQDWQEIVHYLRSEVFNETEESHKEEVKKLAEWYNTFDVENFLDDPKCAKCGAPAEKRCSRCKNEWYCSRECQVEAWPGHKELCEIVCKDRELYGERDFGNLMMNEA